MIALPAALSDIKHLYLDTAPLIYFIERHETYLPIVREVIRDIDQGNFKGFSSTLTLTEVLTHPKRSNNILLAEAYRNLILSGHNFTMVSIDATIAEIAADMRAKYALRTPDALQIATALHTHCEVFLTNDKALKRVSEITILLIDELHL